MDKLLDIPMSYTEWGHVLVCDIHYNMMGMGQLNVESMITKDSIRIEDLLEGHVS